MVTSRREVLGAAAVAGAALVSRGVASGQPAGGKQPDAPKPAGGDAPTPPASAPTTGAGITPETVAAAEAIAGLEFSESKRAMLAKSLPRQVARLGRRRTLPLPENGLAPALTFDPRLPGMKLEREQRAIVRSGAAGVPELPSGEEDIAFAPVMHLSRWIESKKLTSRRLTEIYLARLKKLDPVLKFAVTITEELGLRRAERADAEIAAGKYRGPLHGVPYGAKDLFDTAGILTSWGAEPYADRVPTRDATVIRKLEEAGAVLVAKTTLGALAMGDVWHKGRTNNPWNPQVGSSGSSAGSAAAAAAGAIAFGLGTETLGSIISPSRACGATGLRPTFGRVSRAGAMALCWSLDKVGPIARCSEDCALVLAAINGYDAADSCSLEMPFNFDASRPVAGLRVGFVPASFESPQLHPAHKKALEILKGAGCELVELELPDWPYEVLLNVLRCEAAAAFEELTRSGRDDLLKAQDENAWPNSFREAWFVPGPEVVQSHRFRRQCMGMMREKFEGNRPGRGLDAIVDPTNTGRLCMITNSTGHPSLTIRIGFRDDGMPVATTLVGGLFGEGALVNLGVALEAGLGAVGRRPSLGS